RNTRYGRLVRPSPSGTFTLKETSSFACRTNDERWSVGTIKAGRAGSQQTFRQDLQDEQNRKPILQILFILSLFFRDAEKSQNLCA
ncbi:MAG: hypothetical protein WC091_14115, partial [Sulfuricellaceae bacterium]